LAAKPIKKGGFFGFGRKSVDVSPSTPRDKERSDPPLVDREEDFMVPEMDEWNFGSTINENNTL
jgi:hypothetical protein